MSDRKSDNGNEISLAIRAELERQDLKFGPDKQQSVPGYLLILKNELEEANHAWTKNIQGDHQTCLEEILQVAAVAIRCLSVYGVKGCPKATNDEVKQ